MEVILLERISKLGQMGETVKVRDGFARNYLLPLGRRCAPTPPTRPASKPSARRSKPATSSVNQKPRRSPTFSTASPSSSCVPPAKPASSMVRSLPVTSSRFSAPKASTSAATSSPQHADQVDRPAQGRAAVACRSRNPRRAERCPLCRRGRAPCQGRRTHLGRRDLRRRRRRAASGRLLRSGSRRRRRRRSIILVGAIRVRESPATAPGFFVSIPSI